MTHWRPLRIGDRYAGGTVTRLYEQGGRPFATVEQMGRDRAMILKREVEIDPVRVANEQAATAKRQFVENIWRRRGRRAWE